MPVYVFDVSYDGITSARESVEAEDFEGAVALVDAREPAPRWFDLARPSRPTHARSLRDIDEYARYVRGEVPDPRD